MSMRVDKRTLIAFLIAFLIGMTSFSLLRSELPTANLHVSLVGIDTDAGMIDSGDISQIAKTRSWTGTQIWVDPDLRGDTTFTLSSSFPIIDLLSGDRNKLTVTNDKCGKPDIIATITEPIPIIHEDVNQVTIQDQTYELHKTTWEILLKTMEDSYADTVVAEIAHKPAKDIGIAGVSVSPPVGDQWEGNVYVEYKVKNISGAFIYEVYINKDPRVGVISGKNIDQNLQLYAGAIPAVAYASYESQDEVSFYDSFTSGALGDQIDFETDMTPRGVMALGGKLGVGADPIIDKRTILPDKFEGWNFYNTAIQYQVATVIAIPVLVDEDGNSTGDIVDPDTGLPTGEETDDITGSEREEEQGDPQYYRTDIEDTESALDKLLGDTDLGPIIEDFVGKFTLIFLIGFVIIITLIVLKLLLWLFPRRK